MAKKDTYRETGYPGIKQRISDGKYIVTIDLGRQLRMNKKTGEMEMRQVKTTRYPATLKEAKALIGANNKAKQKSKTTGITNKVPFKRTLKEYTDFYKDGWSDSYAGQKQAQAKRMQAYFGSRDVRSISTLDIEEFFKWCREPQQGFPHPLGNNSIQKIRTHLLDLWKYMKKNPGKYGVKENVVIDSDYGDISRFEATILNAEQINYFLEYCVKNEKDYSTFAMLGLPVLTGLRRGELCGIRWRNVDFEKKLIDVEYQRVQISTGSIEKVPKGGKDNGRSREERKQRYAALPGCLAKLLLDIWDQQTDLLDREPEPDEFVFMTKVNLVNNYLPHPGKVSRRFSELQNRMNVVRKKAGLEPIPHVRLHDLRHTFISLCLNGGVNEFQVSANCGHEYDSKGNSTTVATYWHDDGNRDEIIAFIDKTITAKLKIPDMRV